MNQDQMAHFQQEFAKANMRAMESALPTPPAKPEPQPTDMQGHVARAAMIGHRLAALADAVEAQIGRLYGEGKALDEGNARPPPCGLDSELRDQLAGAETTISRLEEGIGRLAQFA